MGCGGSIRVLAVIFLASAGCTSGSNDSIQPLDVLTSRIPGSGSAAADEGQSSASVGDEVSETEQAEPDPATTDPEAGGDVESPDADSSDSSSTASETLPVADGSSSSDDSGDSSSSAAVVSGSSSSVEEFVASSSSFSAESSSVSAESSSASGSEVIAGGSSSASGESSSSVSGSVEAGESMVCYLGTDAQVRCWGRGNYLGYGDVLARGDQAAEVSESMPTLNLGSDRTAVKVSLGRSHACALLDDQSLKCWGNGVSGALGYADTRTRGDGRNEMGDLLPAVDLGSGETAVDLRLGGAYGCATLASGSLKCWGYNKSGQLGYGDTITRGDGGGEMGDCLPAVDLGTGRSAVQASVSYTHSCALLDDGEVKCWGANTYGQLGYGDKIARGDQADEMGERLPAVQLGSGKTVSSVAVGQYHSCALFNDGTVKCWGVASNGDTGYQDTRVRGDGAGEMGDSLPLVNLGSGAVATQLIAGYSRSTCALLSTGQVKCWGKATTGDLGYGDSLNRGDGANEMGDCLPAVDLGSGASAARISGVSSVVCAQFSDETVKCWGANTSGQLGAGDTLSRGDRSGQMGDSLPGFSVE